MLILLFDGIGSGIQKLLISLVNGFYHLATFFFKIFIILSEGELIDREDYGVLLSNIYVILGIIMLFVLAFTLLKSMINPDDQQQGTTVIKKVVINVVTSAIMLALLPTIFSFAFDFQHSILSQNTLGRLFGIGGTGSAESTVENKANMITNSVYTAFFNVSQTKDGKCVAEDSISITTDIKLSECQDQIENDDGRDDDSFKDIINFVGRTGKFGVYKQFSDSVHDEKIDFDFLMSLIAGACLCYVALSYALDMGVRMVKLVFYQMIAPIPIMFRIIPYGKLSGVFNDWVKVTLSCFLEVFIRLFALYFCVYLCSAISESEFLQFSNFAGHGVMAWLFTKALIFIGIVTFMKSAPQLIGQITGIDSGNMKLGIKDKLAAGGAFAAGAAIGGGVTGMVRNAAALKGSGKGFLAGAGSIIAGTASGAFHSGKAGMSAKSFADMNNASKKGADISSDRRDQRKADQEAHGGFLGNVIYQAKQTGQRVGAHFGFTPNYSQLQAQQETNDAMSGAIKRTKEISEDYVEKHHDEFYFGLKQADQQKLNELNQKIKTTTGEENERAREELKRFSIQHADRRLDVLKARVTAAQKSGNEIKIANAEREYKEALKYTTDNFVTTVFSHAGAEKEALAMEAELKNINQLVSENSNSMVIQTLRNGDEKGLVQKTKGYINEIDKSNAAGFIKQLKNSTEVTSSQIKAERERLQRQQKGDNNK